MIALLVIILAFYAGMKVEEIYAPKFIIEGHSLWIEFRSEGSRIRKKIF